MNEPCKQLIHPFAPVFDSQSRLLVLGSFPSVRSRAEGFYYGHPQNRFWRVLAGVFDAEVPSGIDQKCALLKNCGVALWDAAASCEAVGSADASLRHITLHDVASLLRSCPQIRGVYCNGQTAYHLCMMRPLSVPIILLPSTSPANAKWSLAALVEAWRVICFS